MVHTSLDGVHLKKIVINGTDPEEFNIYGALIKGLFLGLSPSLSVCYRIFQIFNIWLTPVVLCLISYIGDSRSRSERGY